VIWKDWTRNSKRNPGKEEGKSGTGKKGVGQKTEAEIYV
jgi:hypothetical protein